MITFPIGFYKGASGGSFENVYSIDFDGVNDYITGSDSSLPSGNSARSVSVWVNFDSIVQFAAIVGYGTAQTNQAFIINTKSQKIKASFWNVEFEPNNTTLVTSQWYHVVLTYDGSGTAKLYLDGSLEGTKTGLTLNTTHNQINFGRLALSGATQYHDGQIDEVSVFDVELSSSDVTSLYNSGAPTDLSGESNLVGWWRMGDGANYPVIKNQVNFSQVGIEFDGVDDLVQTTGISGVSDPASVSLWLYPLTNGNYKGFFSSENAWSNSHANNFLIQNSNGTVRYLAKDNSSDFDVFTSTATLSLNVWQHVVLTLSGTTLKMYIDGSLDSTHTIVNGGTWGDLANGAHLGFGFAYNNTKMDDVGIYSTELSASDVSNIYNSGIPKDESGRSGLVSYYKFDGDTYPTVTDSVGSSNGTMTNMTSDDFVAAKEAGTMINMDSGDIVEDVPS